MPPVETAKVTGAELRANVIISSKRNTKKSFSLLLLTISEACNWKEMPI